MAIDNQKEFSDPEIADLKKHFLVFLKKSMDEYKTSEITNQIMEDLCEETNSELIDFSTARRSQDWSVLSHQVVGHELT